MTTPAGTLHYLLVIVNPDALTPYDPTSTDLPSEEHYYITSRRRVDHPWIAQQGDGPNARPDISIGGQRLELPLGRTIDGECQVRVIDEPEPIISCDWSIDLLDGDNAFDTPADWTEETSLGVYVAYRPDFPYDPDTPSAPGVPYNLTPPPGNPPRLWGSDPGDYKVGPNGSTSIVAGSHMNAATFVLFDWNDDLQGHSPYGNSGVRDVWRTRTMAGLTPGTQVGITVKVSVILNSNGGWRVFMRAIGTTTEEWSGHLSDVTIWNQTGGFYVPTIPGDFLGTVVPPSGEVTFQLGVENMFASGNINVSFNQVEIAQCVPVESPGPITELYTTGSLADDNARQKQLGRPYYLKASTDGGTTFDEMIYAGFTRQITMERSKTFLLTGGDAGRGRRVSRAWRDLNPVEDFVPA
jgi:hypothetical protein